MQLVFTLPDLEAVLAPEVKRRIGYDEEAPALVKVVAGRAMPNDGDADPLACIIVEVALPEDVAAEVMPAPSKVRSRKAAGTVRGTKGRKQAGSK